MQKLNKAALKYFWVLSMSMFPLFTNFYFDKELVFWNWNFLGGIGQLYVNSNYTPITNICNWCAIEINTYLTSMSPLKIRWDRLVGV